MDFLWTHGFSWFVHICFVFEVQNVQLCQISIIRIQLPIATNLRTRLRRSLQSLAHDIMESLGADHVAIFGDKAALDVLRFFQRRWKYTEISQMSLQSWEQQVQFSIIQIRFAIVLLGAQTSHIFHYFGDLWLLWWLASCSIWGELCGGKYPHPDVAEVQYTRPVQVGVWHFG